MWHLKGRLTSLAGSRRGILATKILVLSIFFGGAKV